MNLNNYIKTVLSGVKTWALSTFANKRDFDELNSRMYHSEQVEKFFFKNTQISPMDSYGDYVNMSFLEKQCDDISVGDTLNVVWDGTEYECKVFKYDGALAIGNKSIMGTIMGESFADTGEPFLIAIWEGQYVEIYYTDMVSESHVISISGMAEKVHQIDKKYLPDMSITDGKFTISKGANNSFIITADNGATYIQSPDGSVVCIGEDIYGEEISVITDIDVYHIFAPTSTQVGDHTYNWVSTLMTASFPMATHVGVNAFYGSSVMFVNVPSATDIDSNAFRSCMSLTTCDCSSARYIGQNAFTTCEQLKAINLPLITNIYTETFWNCRSLTTLDFPLVTNIANRAFASCSSLTSLILRSETLCTLENVNAFNNTPIKNGTGYIYVPAALIDSYKVDNTWSTFANQFRAIEDYPEICGGGASGMPNGSLPNQYVVTDIDGNVKWEDKLCWSEEGKVVLVEPFTDGYGDETPNRNSFAITLEEGKSYIVEWDNVEYNCTCFVDDWNRLVVGNASLMETGANTNEPFLVGVQDGDSFVKAQTGGNHALSISAINETIHPIDKKYLPYEYAQVSYVDEQIVNHNHDDAYYTETEIDNKLSVIEDIVSVKQDKLTFDETPTDGSVNPVTSGGVKRYIDSSTPQSDWNQTDDTAPSYILNKPRVYKNRIVLTDSINGFDYVLKMENGNLVTYSAATSISIAQQPSNITFYNGDLIDISDMVLVATCSDGSVKTITNYTYEPTIMAAGVNVVTITYEEDGNVFTKELRVIGESFESRLMDFEYTDNGDGTYTITGWKETLNGEPSTRMIVPNSNKIII